MLYMQPDGRLLWLIVSPELHKIEEGQFPKGKDAVQTKTLSAQHDWGEGERGVFSERKYKANSMWLTFIKFYKISVNRKEKLIDEAVSSSPDTNTCYNLL